MCHPTHPPVPLSVLISSLKADHFAPLFFPVEIGLLSLNGMKTVFLKFFSCMEKDLTVVYVSWEGRRAQFRDPTLKVTFLEKTLMKGVYSSPPPPVQLY